MTPSISSPIILISAIFFLLSVYEYFSFETNRFSSFFTEFSFKKEETKDIISKLDFERVEERLLLMLYLFLFYVGFMTKYSRMMRMILEIGLGKSVLPSVGHYII